MKKDNLKIELSKFKINAIFIIPIIFCLVSIIYWTRFFIAEIYYKDLNLDKAMKTFTYPIYYFEFWDYEKWLSFYSSPPMPYYQYKIIKNENNLLINCENLVKNYNIAENYIWCWELLEKENYKKESQIFYKKWLSLLPDLWNKNSTYYDNFFVKYTISWNRFMSEKYWNIKKIINSVE